MKLQHLTIENFKGVRKCEIDFVDADGPRQVTALIGDNGSGKTSVLQAIGLVLSLATRRTGYVDQFRWHGFLLDRVSSMGRTHVQVDVQFDDAEIQATQDLFQQWGKIGTVTNYLPSVCLRRSERRAFRECWPIRGAKGLSLASFR